MEKDVGPAKEIARAALEMAVRRLTNDNTILYVTTCMIVALGWVIVVSPAALIAQYYLDKPPLVAFCTASIFGAIGAAFSIISRFDAFEMKPCQQSNMNYWMSGIRVGIGIIGGVILFLLGQTIVNGSVMNPAFTKTLMPSDWEGAAALGFIGGFSERLVQSLLRRTANTFASTAGTPVQEARRLEGASH
jgi:hypothetical protein